MGGYVHTVLPPNLGLGITVLGEEREQVLAVRPREVQLYSDFVS